MDNADLEKLRVSPGKLVPSYKASITEYRVTVDSSVEELKMTVLTADSGASYVVKGTEGGGKLVRLKEGQELNVEIVVTAEDGTSSKSFSISFKRLSASDAILANLQVTPGALEPPFHPSVTEYHCYLQCKVDKLLLQAKPQDQAMKVVLPECAIASSQQDDSSVAAPLNPGHTQLKVSVCSANGANTRVYAIVAVKRALSYPVVLKLPVAAGKGGGAGLLGACANEFSCAVCCGIVHRPSRIIAGERNSSLPSSLVFCQPCLEELTRTNKMDIFTGKVLEGDWLELDFATDEKLASELAECCSPVGTIEAPLGQVGAKLAEQRAKKTEKEEAMSVCPDCSKKVPAIDAQLHKDLLCPAHFSISPPKHQASQTSYAVDSGSPLLKAKQKLMDAVTLAPSDAQACYHLGRLSLLMGDGDTALQSLKAASSLKPTHPHTRVCLGLALQQGQQSKPQTNQTPSPSSSSSSSSSHTQHVRSLLASGLVGYLEATQGDRETRAEEAGVVAVPSALHASCFDQPSNTLVLEAFLALAHLGGAPPLLTEEACLLVVARCVADARLQHRKATYQKCVWAALRARSQLLMMLHGKEEEAGGSGGGGHSPAARRQCIQLSALLGNCGLHPSPKLRELQMKVFQLGVTLCPSSSEALYHLGNGQLSQYEATGDAKWLEEAELSFRASLAVEGGAVNARAVPEQVQQQQWWKEQEQKKKKAASVAASSAKTQQGPSSVGPAGGRASAAAKQTTSAGAQAKRGGGAALQRGGGGAALQRGGGGAGVQQRGGGGAASQQQQQQKAAPPSRTQPGGVKKPAGGAAIGGRGGGGGGRGTTTGPGRGTPGSAGAAAARPGSQVAKATGKGVATLGELKSKDQSGADNKEKGAVNKSTSAPKTTPAGQQAPTKPPAHEEKEPTVKTSSGEINKSSHHPRLGLARVLSKLAGKHEEAHSFYKEVMKMSPNVHDAYIELGEMLAKDSPKEAVDVYSQFPFDNPPSFDDAFLHGEIVRLLMGSSEYDHPQLAKSLIAMGQALGIGVLEKQVSMLEAKFKTGLLKQVYAGVHGKPVEDPELQAFFKFKCWL